jgi:hypothetical protein
MTMTIDQIVVEANDHQVLLSKQDYLKIPVMERIQWILQHKVKFLGAGRQDIPTRQALQILRAERVSG